MTNHHLSVEQRFHLEAAFREIDACEDIDSLRHLTKQIITAQENEKAFAREAMVQVRKEMEAAASQRFGFNWGQSSWLDSKRSYWLSWPAPWLIACGFELN